MIRRNGCVAQDVITKNAIRGHAKTSTTVAVFLMARTASAFMGYGPPTLSAKAPGKFSRNPHMKRAVEVMQSSMAEDASPRDDPWIILEEITTWVVRNKGKYDPMEVQSVINDLRDESRFNIHSLEKEITIIQQSLQNSDFYPPQSTSGESFDDSAAIPVPTLRAVFAGYKVTNYDRMRLASAHPEDHSR
jgi:hypothetical protein